MRTQIYEIKEDLRGSQALTNQRLNELEHHAIQPPRVSRTPISEPRPTPPQGYRHTPPTPSLEFRTLPQHEYRTPPVHAHIYPPPGHRSPIQEFRPHYGEPPYQPHRERHHPFPPQQRRGYHGVDQDERLLKSVKIDARTFEGQLDPTKFLNWLADMDHYFEWYEMNDERQVFFAKMKLVGKAKLY